MRLTALQYLRRLGGTALFIIGVVALVLPLLPGFVFIALGLYVLSIDSPKIHEHTKRIRYRYKHIDTAMVHVERRLIRRTTPTEAGQGVSTGS